MKQHLIGRGRLTWDRAERQSDRYGAIYLLSEGDSNTPHPTLYAPLDIPPDLEGSHVHLIAKVIETRESTHIGDLFHGVFPRTPRVGEIISFGDGIIRRGTNCEGSDTVVLIPVKMRDHFWMSIRALYDAHEQTVDLIAKMVGV